MTTVSQVNIERALKTGGWMSERELTWLAENATKCKTIVEFGSYHGRSTIALADNAPSDARIWAVDPWNGDYETEQGQSLPQVNTYCYPYFRRNLKEHIESLKVLPVRMYSYKFDLPHEVDMVFIDGDHRYETVVKDLNVALKLTKTGGLICGHDWNHPTWPGVKKGFHQVFGPLQPEVVDTIWSIRKF